MYLNLQWDLLILLNEGDKVKIGMPFIEVVIDDLPDKDIKESKTEIKEDPPKEEDHNNQL